MPLHGNSALVEPGSLQPPLAQVEPPGWGQFVLGPRPAPRLPNWTHHAAAGNLWLSAHPGLNVVTVGAGDRTLTLIGFLLDPGDPAADDRAILRRLLSACQARGALIAATETLGGRWILIGAFGGEHFLITDALGLRQVLHTEPGAAEGVWALSQPGLALHTLGLRLGEGAAEFLDSYAMRSRPEYRWPAAGTPVAGLRRLLPNHVLDLHSGEATRYWPHGVLPQLSPPEARARLAGMLPALIRAAASRFELALSITAGLDSRLVLAAARAVRDRLCYLTVRQGKMADEHPDVVIPARLLARLGLEHEVIRARGTMSPEFSLAFKRHAFLAHDHYGPDAEAILRRYGRRKVALTGSGAEVGRCSFRDQHPLSRWRRLRAADLARLQGMPHPFALRWFDDWLADAGEPGNVKLLDLFEWEQGHGNWLATTQLEFDIAWRDVFTPFNCRALLTTMLAVDERFRRRPRYPLFRTLIEELWRDVLSEPINPRAGAQGLRGRLGGMRRRLAAFARAG